MRRNPLTPEDLSEREKKFLEENKSDQAKREFEEAKLKMQMFYLLAKIFFSKPEEAKVKKPECGLNQQVEELPPK